MNVDKIAYRPLLSWLSLAVLIALVCVLGVLQYRWIGEISEIEQKKLQDYLRTSLVEASREFNSDLNSACAAILPTNTDVEELGREQAYEQRYSKWKNSTNASRLFDRIALAWEQNDGIYQGTAVSDEFRTVPLWGLGQRLCFLHDGPDCRFGAGDSGPRQPRRQLCRTGHGSDGRTQPAQPAMCVGSKRSSESV